MEEEPKVIGSYFSHSAVAAINLLMVRMQSIRRCTPNQYLEYINNPDDPRTISRDIMFNIRLPTLDLYFNVNLPLLMQSLSVYPVPQKTQPNRTNPRSVAPVIAASKLFSRDPTVETIHFQVTVP